MKNKINSIFLVKKIILFVFAIGFSNAIFAQSDLKLGNNAGAKTSSAVLEIESTTKGILLPRMTTAQMNAIVAPTTGLMVYNTDLNCIHYFFGGWKSQCDPANLGAWALLGNAGTTPATNFLGTTDNQDLWIKTNGNGRMRIGKNGHIGLGNYANQPIDNVSLLWNIPSSSIAFNLQDSISDFSKSLYQGMIALIKVKPAADWGGNAYAGNFDIHTPSNYTGNLTGAMIGYAGDVRHFGSGTVGSLIAANNAVTNSGSGTVTNAYGWNGFVTNNGTGTLTNAYGIYSNITRPTGTLTNGYAFYAPDVEATNGYGMYQAGVNDLNYFAGNTGIGTTTPGSALDVKGAFRLSGSTSGFVGFAPPAVAGSTTYTLPSADGTSGQQLTTNGTGTLSWVNASQPITNTLILAGNTLTSTVNGIVATSNAVSTVVNTSAANNLTTTVNGVAATAVPIINTVANTSTANTLTTTVNGIAGTAVNIINTNTSTLSGTSIINTINGVATTPLDLTPAIGTAAWTLDGNTLAGIKKLGTISAFDLPIITNNIERIRILSTGNVGIGTTTPGSALDVKGAIRLSGATSGFVGFTPAAVAGSTTYTLPAADGTTGQQLTTNGTGTLSWVNASQTTTNTLTLAGNTLTSTVDGVAATSNAVSTVANTSTGNNLTTTVNGVAATAVPIINTVVNTSTANTFTTTVNGVAATAAPIINTNTSSLSGTSIINTVNGVATTPLDLSPVIGASAWALDGNTLTSIKKLGTISSHDVPVITGNVERMRILSTGNIGMATTTPNSTVQVAGSFSTAIRTITPSSPATDNATATDYTIVVNCTTSTLTLTLPAAATCAGRTYIIKKMDAANALTFSPAIVLDLSQNITTTTMSSTYMLQSDGTNWLVVNRF